MSTRRPRDPEAPLGKLEKLVRANRLRRTRFHTERGEVLPLSAIPDALRSLRTRLTKGAFEEAPWLSPSAVRALSELLDPQRSVVLELGSGASTAWLAARAKSVVSWESLPEWAAQVRGKLAELGLNHVALREVSIDDTPAELAKLAPDSFDLVLVDCLESALVKRADLLVPTARLVRPGGCIVLDDSDRAHLRRAPELLSGFTVERHVGMKPFPLMAIETTLFRKPGHADSPAAAPTRPSATPPTAARE